MKQDPTELLASTRRALLHRVAVGQTEGRAPSLVAGVVRDGQLVWWAGRGSVNGAAPASDTQYRIGSITKTFVAVLVMRLRDEGLVDLSAPLETYLPGTAVADRTVRQLLSHTAGVASETPPPWWERTAGSVRPELADLLGDRALKHAPGQRFHYSNPGFALLGAMVARIRHRSWGEVLQDEILVPLRMSRTTLMPQPPHALGWAVHPWADVLLPEPTPDTGLMAPAGQLWSTVTDLGRYASFLMDGDDDVLSAATLEEMRQTASPSADADGSGYGLGLQLFGGPRPLVGHGGSMPGFLASVGCSIVDGLAAVAYANATSGPLVGSVVADLISIVAEAEPRLSEPWRPLPEVDATLLALTGPWYWGAAPLAIRLLADRGLELKALGSRTRESRFRPQPDGTWLGLDNYYAGETMRVVRDDAGAVTHLDLGSFVLTRQPYSDTGVVPGGVDADGWSADSTPDGTPQRVAEHVAAFNQAATSGDWGEFAERFTEPAVMTFVGVDSGPFTGRQAIAAAYAAQPPNDTLVVRTVESSLQTDTVGFVWSSGGAGTMRLTWEDDLVSDLEVAFGPEPDS